MLEEQTVLQGLEVTGIPDSTESKYLNQPTLKVFEMVDPSNIEDCHWIKTSNGSKKVTISKISKPKYAAKNTVFKEKVEGD